MKWIALAIGLLGALLLGLLLRRTPRQVPHVWRLVGFLPFALWKTAWGDIALVSWPWFSGYVHGLEVSWLDLTVLALHLGQRPTRLSTPLRVARLGYLGAVVLSISRADHPVAALFVAWQLLRMYFVFSVVVRACRDTRVPAAVLDGMSMGVLFTAAFALAQRYLLGYHEAVGTFVHQNVVGMMCNFAVMPSLALLLAGRGSRRTMIAPLAGAIAVILSLSRGGLLMLIAGFGLTVMFSLRRLSLRKMAIVAAGVVLGGALLARAYDQFLVRFTERSWGTLSTEGGLDERARLALASEMMVRENPLGVGANHHTWALHGRGYFQRAGLVEHGGREASKSHTDAIRVHNLYLLTATELGYVGVAALMWLLLALLITIFWNAWRTRRQTRADVIFALGGALLLFLVQGWVEWIQLAAIPQYAFWLSAGVALGLGRTGQGRPAARRTTVATEPTRGANVAARC